MEKRSVTLELPKQVWDALQKRDLSLQQAVAKVLHRHVTETLQVVDTDLDVVFRENLSEHFEKARSWPELQGRLKVIGLSLRESPDGLALFESSTHQRLCGVKRLGWSETSLANRLGRPFPRAIQRWLRDSQIDGAEDQPKSLSGRKQAFASASHRR